MMLSETAIGELMDYCRFRAGENVGRRVMGEGVFVKSGFHPDRLGEKEAEIIALLEDLPDTFKKGKGCGAPFWEMCFNRHGENWTTKLQFLEGVLMLGSAIGRVSFVFPRDWWFILPDGKPYVVVDI